MRNNVMKLSRALLACLLALSMIFGIGAMYAPTVIAADASTNTGSDSTYQDPSQITPTQVQAAEKPYVTIETNLVVDATGKSTGYVELALKVTTPTLYYADKDMTILRYVDDGLENKTGYASLGKFDPENHATYVTTRQTTFRDIAVTLEYDNKLLMPVSWTHSAEDGDSTAYPDFFFDYYGYEYIEEDTKINGIDVKQGIYKSEDIDALSEAENTTAITITPISEAAVMADLNSRTDFSVSVPVLQDSTDITSAMAFTQTNVDDNGANTGTSLLALSVNSSVDIAFPEETTLAVVRFYYLGTGGATVIDGAITPTDAGRVVDTKQFISRHDRAVTTADSSLKSLFNFAPDASLTTAPAHQILYYSAGNYVGYFGDGIDDMGDGANTFYATKYIYQGTEVALPSYESNFVTASPNSPTGMVNYTESTAGLLDANSGALDLPLTGAPQVANKDPYYGTGRQVVAAINESLETGAAGYYSYTTNLLFSSHTQEFVTNSNVRFTMAAEESYNAGGGTDIDNVATIVFLDWDDSILGALSVVKGDTRAAVEAYIENFVHPSLRASNYKGKEDDASQTMLKNLATSLERQYTYAGKYPSTDEDKNGLFEVPVDTNGNGTIDTDEWNDAKLGTNYFPDDYIVTTGTGESAVSTDLSGSSYPLTNKLDYAFLRRPVTNIEEVKDKYTNDNGETVTATEWTTGVIDYTGTATENDANDDYFYIHGWAVVEDPRESEGIWTTFGGAGELASVRFPGYDTDGDNDGRSSHTNNEIRAAKDTSKVVTGSVEAFGGTTSAGTDGGEISFATYGVSEYFEFMDFSNVDNEDGAIFVKACYEPAEEISWSDNYAVISEPYYIKYSDISSTENGSTYGILFDYERMKSGFGVLRIREPYIRARYTVDDSVEGGGIITGTEITLGVVSDNGEVISVEFTPPGTVHTFTYTLVEAYGSSSFVLGADRSTDGNEAGVLSNFKYLQAGKEDESYLDGFKYENRQGSDGFVYRATLRQILEEGTNAIKNNDSTEFFELLNQGALVDLNLRLNDAGLSAENLDDREAAMAFDSARNAVFDAIKIAYDKKVFDDTGIVELEWHQLQYHILHWEEGGNGIATPAVAGEPIRKQEDCGSYAWCRRDECSEAMEISTLKDALEAVSLLDDENAEAALKANLIRVLTENAIVSGDGEYTDRDDVIDNLKYTDSDFAALIEALKKLLVANGGNTDMSAGQVQNWLITGTDYTDPKPENSDGNLELMVEYWWLYWSKRPYEVPFSAATPDTAIELIVEAVVSESDDANALAWAQLEDNIERMRFRASVRGDFFDTEYLPEGSAYEEYLAKISDTRTELVLKAFGAGDDAVPIETFKQRVTDFVKAFAGTEPLNADDIIEAIGDNAWEKLQYYLVNGGMTSTPEYYEGDVYWWKDPNVNSRITANTAEPPDDGTEEDIAAYYESFYAYTGTDLVELREKLNEYAKSPTDENKVPFKVWFTPEVAADLILRRYSTSTTSTTAEVLLEEMADRLLSLATQHIGAGNNDCSTISWSQMQYYIINNPSTYVSTKNAQSGAYGTDETDPWSWSFQNSDNSKGTNRWLEGKQESIQNLKALIVAIAKHGTQLDGGATDNSLGVIESISELEQAPFYFRFGSSVTDVTSLITALEDLESAYGTNNWKILADASLADAENPISDDDLENVWFMIQYYLEKGGLVASETDVLADTAAEGKKLYWWYEGWSGIETFTDLRTAVTSKIDARIYWLTSDKAPYDVDAEHKPADMNLLWGLRSGINTTLDTWYNADLQAAFFALQDYVDGNTTWWRYLQFLMLHDDQSYEDGEGASQSISAFDMAGLVATDEGAEFYWWLDTNLADEDEKTYKMVGPITSTTTTADARKIIWTAAVLYTATGNVIDLEDTDGDGIPDGDDKDDILNSAVITQYFNLRNPDGDVKDEDLVEGDSRDRLDPYDDGEILTALVSIVKKAYEDNVSRTTNADADDNWDFVTDAGVFTYNSGAYAYVLTITPAQLQHYMYADELISAEEADKLKESTYWWLEKETKPPTGNALRDSFELFFTNIIAYSLEYTEALDSGDFVRLDDIVATCRTYIGDFGGTYDVSKPTSSNTEKSLALGGQFYDYTTADGYGGLSWLQCRILLGKRKVYSVDDAISNQGTYVIPDGLDGTFEITSDEITDARSYLPGIDYEYTT